jgi:pilus assembly protein CpaF
MRPDRIIVGEVRESSAVEVMLSAANTGHDGTMTTLHATNADGALTRMATLLMVAAPGYNYDIARLEVASAIDLVVHISRRGGHRFVSEIALVDPAYIGANSVGPLGLFEGEVSVSADDEGNVTEVHPTFRAKGKVPRATKLGMKLTDLGRGAERWLS